MEPENTTAILKSEQGASNGPQPTQCEGDSTLGLIKTQRKCRHCRLCIDHQATVCPQCRLYQASFTHYLQFAPLLFLIANAGIAIATVGISLLNYRVGVQQRTRGDDALKQASDVQEKARAIAEVAVLGNQANVGARKPYERLLARREAKDQDIANLAKEWATTIQLGLDVYRVPYEYRGDWAIFTVPFKGKPAYPADLPTEFLFKEMTKLTLDVYSRKNIMSFIVDRTNQRTEIARLARRRIQDSQYLPELAAICGVLEQLFGERAQFMDYQHWEGVLDDVLTKQRRP